MAQSISLKFTYRLLAFIAVTMTFSQVGCDTPQLTDSTGNPSQQTPERPTPWQDPAQQHSQPAPPTNPAPAANPNAGSAANNSAAAEKIIMGSFNIQSFGKAKMSKPAVVGALVDIARRFDILAIQELREKDQTVIPIFLEYINQNGAAYAAAVGPRQGYVVAGKTTRYFEQSVFIYDTEKIEIIGNSYAAIDRANIMHRPPFVGQFRCKTANPNLQPFSFNLMNVHIDPDDAHQEFLALQPILAEIYQQHPREDDFILLGDFNDEPHKYARYQWMQQQHAALPPQWKTNTAMTKAYDNIVFDKAHTAEFTGQAGVMNLMEEFRLSRDDAKHISDHMPVWAVFSSYEAVPARQAATPAAIR